jgi:secreted trypsin-like serine protease
MRTLFLALLASLVVFVANAQTTLQAYHGSGGPSRDELQQLNAVLGGISLREVEKNKLNVGIYLDPRIIGGRPTNIEESPWQVALIFGQYKEPFRAQFCGGSIIGDSWIATAAHCVVNDAINRAASNVNVVANTTFYNSGGDRIEVEDIRVNSDYNPASNDSDIALLKLKGHATPLKAITLPNPNDDLPPNTNLTVTGWGTVREGDAGTAYLISANIPVVPNTVCNDSASYNGAITNKMICAGLRAGGLDACQGDSGGPAVATSNQAKLLMGIVSFGEGCARKDKYGVYTNVRAFRSWIDSQEQQ